MQAGCRSCLRKNTNWNGRPVRWTYWHDTVRKAIKSWAVYSQGTRDGCRTQHLNRSSSPRNGGTLHCQQRRNSSTPLQLRSICTIFWDRKGVLLVDFLPKGSKINPGAHSDTQKKKLSRAIHNKWRGTLSRGVVMIHENARPNTAAATQNHITTFGWEQFDHPLYSPDLAPSDFHLFLHLKSFLAARRFHNDNEVKEAVTTCIA